MRKALGIVLAIALAFAVSVVATLAKAERARPATDATTAMIATR